MSAILLRPQYAPIFQSSNLRVLPKTTEGTVGCVFHSRSSWSLWTSWRWRHRDLRNVCPRAWLPTDSSRSGRSRQGQQTTKVRAWWRHQMETFSALLAICAGNSPVTSEFPAQRPVMRSFDVFFDLRLNKRLSKQSRGWWFDTPMRPLWHHRYGINHSRAEAGIFQDN